MKNRSSQGKDRDPCRCGVPVFGGWWLVASDWYNMALRSYDARAVRPLRGRKQASDALAALTVAYAVAGDRCAPAQWWLGHRRQPIPQVGEPVPY